MIVRIKCCGSGEAIAVEACMIEYTVKRIVHNGITHVPKVNVAKITTKNNEVIYVIAEKKDIRFVSEHNVDIYARAYTFKSYESDMEEFIREMEKAPVILDSAINSMSGNVIH